MRFNLHSLVVLAVTAPLVTCQFTISYWQNPGCGGIDFACDNIPSYECCEGPINHAFFQRIQVTSGGQTGIVIFTVPTGPAQQGCGACQFTGNFNTCYYNTNADPYNTAYVATFIVCRSSVSSIEERTAEIFGIEKQNVTLAQAAAPSECKNTRQANRLTTADGISYDITGSERDVLVEDAINMDAADFKAKWAHLTIETPLHALKQRVLISDGEEEK
ncbi:hypothetical protein N431DRAFT_457373 [Stipitochalara longipes BDJ]|nr:hypothetical protein N431DRAFT_457373 [Stipitochalara longipes BDJ]